MCVCLFVAVWVCVGVRARVRACCAWEGGGWWVGAERAGYEFKTLHASDIEAMGIPVCHPKPQPSNLHRKLTSWACSMQRASSLYLICDHVVCHLCAVLVKFARWKESRNAQRPSR